MKRWLAYVRALVRTRRAVYHAASPLARALAEQEARRVRYNQHS